MTKVNDILSTSGTLRKIHQAVMRCSKDVMPVAFPIYIKYFKNDKVIAILYFKGKFVDLQGFVLGVNTKKQPSFGFSEASYMKDPSITYGVRLGESVKQPMLNQITKLLKNELTS